MSRPAWYCESNADRMDSSVDMSPRLWPSPEHILKHRPAGAVLELRPSRSTTVLYVQAAIVHHDKLMDAVSSTLPINLEQPAPWPGRGVGAGRVQGRLGSGDDRAAGAQDDLRVRQRLPQPERRLRRDRGCRARRTCPFCRRMGSRPPTWRRRRSGCGATATALIRSTNHCCRPKWLSGRHILVVWAPASQTRPHRAPDGTRGPLRYWVRVGADTVDAEQRGEDWYGN